MKIDRQKRKTNLRTWKWIDKMKNNFLNSTEWPDGNVSHETSPRNRTRLSKQKAQGYTNTEIQHPKLICTQFSLKQSELKQLPRTRLAPNLETSQQRHFPPKHGWTGDGFNVCSCVLITIHMSCHHETLNSHARISKFTVARRTGLVQSRITQNNKKLQERVALQRSPLVKWTKESQPQQGTPHGKRLQNLIVNHIQRKLTPQHEEDNHSGSAEATSCNCCNLWNKSSRRKEGSLHMYSRVSLAARRGTVNHWKGIENAMEFKNTETRSTSLEQDKIETGTQRMQHTTTN